jgi:hypothetical protein
LASSRLAQAAKPDLGLGILNGSFLKELCFKLNSSISAVREPSAYFPPNTRILDFDIARAENLVLADYIAVISFQTPRYVSKTSHFVSFLSLKPEKAKIYSSLT